MNARHFVSTESTSLQVPVASGFAKTAMPSGVKTISFALIDVIGWASPEFAISIGGGGAKRPYPDGGGAGSIPNEKGEDGLVKYTWSKDIDLVADVVPLVPTSSGTFTKPNNTAGSFPDLGPGFWTILTNSSSASLGMGAITVAPGKTITGLYPTGMSFFASQRPSYSGGANRENDPILVL